MKVHSVTLCSHDEAYAPPRKVLDVSVVDDVVFLSIFDYDEDNTSVSMTNGTCIGVEVSDLFRALVAFSPGTVTKKEPTDTKLLDEYDRITLQLYELMAEVAKARDDTNSFDLREAYKAVLTKLAYIRSPNAAEQEELGL